MKIRQIQVSLVRLGAGFESVSAEIYRTSLMEKRIST